MTSSDVLNDDDDAVAAVVDPSLFSVASEEEESLPVVMDFLRPGGKVIGNHEKREKPLHPEICHIRPRSLAATFGHPPLPDALGEIQSRWNIHK